MNCFKEQERLNFFSICLYTITFRIPHWLSGKESACNPGDAGDLGSILGLGKSPGGGAGNPFQHAGLENPMDRGAWQATVCGGMESDIGELLSSHARITFRRLENVMLREAFA